MVNFKAFVYFKSVDFICAQGLRGRGNVWLSSTAGWWTGQPYNKIKYDIRIIMLLGGDWNAKI